jgi:hypothetical protein
MALRIEIVGEGLIAQRMLHQLLALKGFEITSVPAPLRRTAVSAPRGQKAATIAVEGGRNGVAILQENEASDAIEGLPVVTLRARKERFSVVM